MGNRPANLVSPGLGLDPSAVAVVERAAIGGYPEEACGVMIGQYCSAGRIDVQKIVPLPNHAAAGEKRRRYEINPRLLLHWDRVARETGTSIVGFFHSHPDQDPRPSTTDAQLAWPDYAYLIASVSRSSSRGAIVTGLAAWTFDEASTSFRELKIEVRIEPNEIEYYI